MTTVGQMRSGMNPRKTWRRLLTHLKDAGRYSASAGAVVFAKSLLGSWLNRNPIRRAGHLLQAYRLTFRPFWEKKLARRLSIVQSI